jgi:hypothetical protein
MIRVYRVQYDDVSTEDETSWGIESVSSNSREDAMITLCIRYTIDQNKYKDFEDYAKAWPEPIRRCGGELVGYFAPTKLAGATNFALALITFPDLGAYERYRAALMNDADAQANVAQIEASGCLLNEDRGFMQQIK